MLGSSAYYQMKRYSNKMISVWKGNLASLFTVYCVYPFIIIYGMMHLVSAGFQLTEQNGFMPHIICFASHWSIFYSFYFQAYLSHLCHRVSRVFCEEPSLYTWLLKWFSYCKPFYVIRSLKPSRSLIMYIGDIINSPSMRNVLSTTFVEVWKALEFVK